MTLVANTTPEANCFDAARIESVFNTAFSQFNTVLSGGASEPLYSPATSTETHHTLSYREDFFASALHESAHWCIAGEARRQQQDFGYWYSPDGRNPEQQKAFEAVEVKPQALEWFFSQACAYPFSISLDNLGQSDSTMPDSSDFKAHVIAQAKAWQRDGLPARGQILFTALSAEFATAIKVQDCQFLLEVVA
ncbi:MAG: elongation factor P hydroxylase [Halioglobus sp.]